MKVAVTGGTGFIAAWCIRDLLDAGHEVVTTVRDPASSKAKFLRDLVDAGARLQIERADLLDDESVWVPLLAGCEVVHHVASPVFFNPPKDPEEVIRPAVKGAEVVMRAAVKAKVRRCVLTSSTAAIQHPMQAGKVYTPNDWTDSSAPKITAYQKSKCEAEKAAWAIVHSEENTSGLELTTINPAFVFGAGVSGNELSASQTIVKTMLEGGYPLMPECYLGVVHVRDVSLAHVQAMAAAEAAGKRLILSETILTFRDISQILHERWPDRGVLVREGPAWLFSLLAKVDSAIAQVEDDIAKTIDFDTSETKRVLDFQFRPAREGIVELAESIVDDCRKPASCAVM